MRRFLQFRLSTVFMFVAMCAMALGWWKDQRDLRGELTDLRGKVNVFNVEMDERIEDVLRATDPGAARVAYRNLFAVAGSTGLRRLILDPRDGIAIQSVWEFATSTLPEGAVAGQSRRDPHMLKEFYSFLEDRARVKVPEWWLDIVLQLKAQNGFYVDNLGKVPVSNIATRLSEEGGKVALRIGTDSLAVPEEALDEDRRPTPISALVTSDRCYLTTYDGWGSPHDLASVDRASGKMLWKTRVWGAVCRYRVKMGWSDARVTVTEQDGRVVVFGAAPSGVYMEAFRADDGSNLFRFSSAY